MSTNWLHDAIVSGGAAQDRKHCFVRHITDYSYDEPIDYYTLADYESGYPVLGEFLNTYGKWESADEARRVAHNAGYRCDPEDDDEQIV